MLVSRQGFLEGAGLELALRVSKLRPNLRQQGAWGQGGLRVSYVEVTTQKAHG